MKLTVKQLKNLIREAMEEMKELDSDLMDMSRDELLSLYSDMYKEQHNIRPRGLGEYSEDELRGMVQNLRDTPFHDEHDESDIADFADYEDMKKWGQEQADRHHEFEQMKVPEEGEEFPGHEGMGRRLTESLSVLIQEVLEEAKKYKGKSMRPGGGGRFAKLVDKLKASGKSEESAKAIAAAAGRKKYGAAKMKQMAKAGKKRAAKK